MTTSPTADHARAELAEVQSQIDAVEESLARLAGADDASVADLARSLARLQALYARWAELKASLDVA